MLGNTIHLLTKADPLKSLLSQPALSGRTARWLLKLSEFERIQIPFTKSKQGLEKAVEDPGSCRRYIWIRQRHHLAKHPFLLESFI